LTVVTAKLKVSEIRVGTWQIGFLKQDIEILAVLDVRLFK